MIKFGTIVKMALGASLSAAFVLTTVREAAWNVQDEEPTFPVIIEGLDEYVSYGDFIIANKKAFEGTLKLIVDAMPEDEQEGIYYPPHFWFHVEPYDKEGSRISYPEKQDTSLNFIEISYLPDKADKTIEEDIPVGIVGNIKWNWTDADGNPFQEGASINGFLNNGEKQFSLFVDDVKSDGFDVQDLSIGDVVLPDIPGVTFEWYSTLKSELSNGLKLNTWIDQDSLTIIHGSEIPEE